MNYDELYAELCNYVVRNFENYPDVQPDDGLKHTSDYARRHALAIFELLKVEATVEVNRLGGFDTSEMPWNSDGVGPEIVALVPTLTDPISAVVAIQEVLNRHGYDSVDREKAFVLASVTHSWKYDDLYAAWLNQPSTDGD